MLCIMKNHISQINVYLVRLPYQAGFNVKDGAMNIRAEGANQINTEQ